MGSFGYGSSHPALEIDDSTLAHLQLVISVMLRRGQSFFLTIEHGARSGIGRSVLWIAPQVEYRVRLHRIDSVRFDGARVDQMLEQARSARGLVLRLRPRD